MDCKGELAVADDDELAFEAWNEFALPKALASVVLNRTLPSNSKKLIRKAYVAHATIARYG